MLTLPTGAVAGDPVTVHLSATRGQFRCVARHHDSTEPLDVPAQWRRTGVEASFTPDREGRWWVAFRGGSAEDGTVAQGCFWVAPRRA